MRWPTMWVDLSLHLSDYLSLQLPHVCVCLRACADVPACAQNGDEDLRSKP
jgi:hypothetical protein